MKVADLTRYSLKDAVNAFSSEPLYELASSYELSEFFPTKLEVLSRDLNWWLYVDKAWRWEHDSDTSESIVGPGGTGKSNTGISHGLDWCSITGKPYFMSNITFALPQYNLWLKGYKLRFGPTGLDKLEEFNLDAMKGQHVMLDEGSDKGQQGMLGMTIVSDSGDMEGRMRKLQIGRFFCGTRTILHSAYYHIEALKRDVKKRECLGLVWMNVAGKRINLGSITTPFIDKTYFAHYDKPKVASIKAYTKGMTAYVIAELMNYFAKELWNDEKFQALSMKPVSTRINYLMRSQRYQVWNTEKYYVELEKMTRNKDLHALLNKATIEINSDNREDSES